MKKHYLIPSDAVDTKYEEGDWLFTSFSFAVSNRTLYATSVESKRAYPTTSYRPPVILLHGGGPDHESLIPLAKALTKNNTVILPDIRGYGRFVCTDPFEHTWAQYAEDVIGLMNAISTSTAIVGGAGLGSTISLRAALAYTDRIEALVLISAEDIEDDEAKAKEVVFMEQFAKRVREDGIEKAWEPILVDLSPVIRSMVTEAIPRSNPESIAAAASIGYDRSFRSIQELSSILVPTLLIPGMDWRHPEELARKLLQIIPKSVLASLKLSTEVKTKTDFAMAFENIINNFLSDLNSSRLRT